MPQEPRTLKVFLCHSSDVKPIVRELYEKLNAEGWIDPWLDEEKLNPGDSWAYEIEKAVEETEIILVCLSKQSVNKEGYVQRELRVALDFADYKPEGTVFIIPIRLEECDLPRRLRSWQYADYFPEDNRDHSYEKLLNGLKKRANGLGIVTVRPMREALREATLEEDARLINQVIRESAERAERVKEQMRSNLISVAEEIIDESGAYVDEAEDYDYDQVIKQIRIPIPADKQYLYTMEDGVAIRSYPSLRGKLLERLTANTKIITLESKVITDAKVGVPGQWIQVQTPDEKQGYIAAWWVTKANPFLST
jgi:TIR domain/Bacterial SH3 domain